MDLQLTKRRALVCGASSGLGYACALALAREGADVCIVARNEHTLQQAASQIQAETGKAATKVVADVTQPEGRQRVLAVCPEPDILVTNAGGPPTGDIQSFNTDDWLTALNNNMLAPIELIRAVIDDMADKGYGRIVNITSAALKAPVPALGLSTGARLGLTGFVSTIARQYASKNVTVNNILPGAFLTQRLRTTAQVQAERSGQSTADILDKRQASIPAKRFGDPEEFGALCAYLCSEQASYITSQNIVIDGGSYPGIF